MPAVRRDRFAAQYALSPQDAALLTSERTLADYYEAAAGGDEKYARPAANWIANDLMGLQNERGLSGGDLPISAIQLRELIELVDRGTLSGRAAKELVPQINSGESVQAAAQRLNLLVLTDESALREAVQGTLAAFPAAVADYRPAQSHSTKLKSGPEPMSIELLPNPDLLEEIGHPWIRINYDPGNVVYYAGVRPEEDIVHARGLIGHVHLKDKRGGKGILDFPPLGEGELDIPAMLGELQDSGFSGPVSMEIEFKDYQFPDWSECVEAARRGKAYWDSLGYEP